MTDKISIMVWGAGNQVALFKAMRQEGCDDHLWVVDNDAQKHPAGLDSDAAVKVITGGNFEDSSFFDDILEKMPLPESEKQGVILPATDRAVLELAKNKDRIHNNSRFRCLCPDVDVVSKLGDKRENREVFKSCGLNYPEPGDYPVFVKPRFGKSSAGAMKVDNQEQEAGYSSLFGDYVRQRMLSGVEISVDAYADMSGKLVYVSPRLRLSTSGGTATETLTTSCPPACEAAAQIATILRGPFTLQGFMEGDRFVAIECNPRIGGGLSCSLLAGVPFARILKSDYMDQPVGSFEIRDGVGISRAWEDYTW